MIAIQECTVFDLRMTQVDREGRLPRYLRHLIMQMAKDYLGGSFYFMLDRKYPQPSFCEDFKNFGQFFFVEEGMTLFKKRRIHHYFISQFTLPVNQQNFFEFLFPSFLYGHAPYIFGIIGDLTSKNDTKLEKQRMDLFACIAMREVDHLFAINNHDLKEAVKRLNISQEKVTSLYGEMEQEIWNAIHSVAYQQEKQVMSFETFYKWKYFADMASHHGFKNSPKLMQVHAILSKMQRESSLNLKQVSLKFIKKWVWKKASAVIAPYLRLPCKQPVEQKSLPKALPMFAILPPDDSGIAEYNYATFRKTPWNIHFYHHFPSFKNLIEFNAKSKNQAYHHKLFPIFHQLYGYQKAIFILGNSHHHIHGLNYLLNENAVMNCEKYIYLHDVHIMNLWYTYFKNNLSELKLFLKKFYPEKEQDIFACQSREEIMAQVKVYGIRPLKSLCHPKKLLVNSQEAQKLVIQDLGHLASIECETLFLPIIREDVSTSSVTLPRSDSEIWIGHFGCLAVQKHPDILLQACKILSQRYPIKLIFAGYHLKQSLSLLKSKLPDFVTLFDSPSREELLDLMQQVDIAVQLRWPTDGGISGVVNQLISLHKPVIATNKGFFGDLKDALILTPEGITAPKLAKVIEQTMINKDQLSQQISCSNQKFSLEVFFERFQAAIQL